MSSCFLRRGPYSARAVLIQSRLCLETLVALGNLAAVVLLDKPASSSLDAVGGPPCFKQSKRPSCFPWPP